MGSNLKTAVVAGVFSAIIAGLNPSMAADASLKGVLGHIDIPEIARSGDGPKTPDLVSPNDLAMDPDFIGAYWYHDRLLRGDDEGSINAAPFFDEATPVLPQDVSAVPSPGAVGLGLLALGSLGFRRRRS